MPKPFMRGHKAFNALAAVGVGRHGAARQHAFQDMQQLLRDFIIALVAGVMEGQQILSIQMKLRQPAGN